jgi:PAS domain S-box-containing protein
MQNLDRAIITDLLSFPHDLTLAAVLARMGAAQPADYALIMDGERLVGLITASSALAWLHGDPAVLAGSVGAVAEPAFCLRRSALTDLRQIAHLFESGATRHLIVTDEHDCLLGLIRPASLLTVLTDQLPTVASQSAELPHLRDSERLHLTLSVTNQGLYDLNLRTNEVTVSPAYAIMLGYEPTSFRETTASWRTRLHPDDAERASATLDAYIAGLLSEYSQEFRLRTADGSWKWVLSLGRIIDRAPDGHPLRMIGTHTDITLLKETEQELVQLNQELERRVAERTADLERSQAELRKSEAHLIAAQRIALLGSWEFEVPSRAIIWSPEVYRIFERDPEQGPPSFADLQEIYLPEDREQHNRVIEHAIASRQAYTLDLRLRRPNGELRYIQARGEPVIDDNGQLLRLVGTVLDITERKQAEQQRRNMADRLAVAVRSAAIGIWEWNIVKNELSWDQRMYELYGVNPHSYDNTYTMWANGLHPDDRDAAELAIQQALSGERDFDTEFRVVCPDGTIRDIKASGLVQRNAAGEPLRMIGVNFDITERKRVEATLRENGRQLQALNHELEAFAYSVSHDLRTPLRAIDGFSQALVEDYADKLDDMANNYLTRIRSGVQRMDVLIDDLLRLARVTRREMRVTQVNLSRQAQQISADLQSQQPERRVTWVIAPNLSVWADANLIRVALGNLLANAWKFTSHHEQARIEFGMYEADGQRVFFVRDDGAGFNPAYQSKLFGVFQRLHNHHEFVGTGIGLATVQRVIARHGGQVWATGAIEEGASFFFTLPDPPAGHYHYEHTAA